MHVCNVYASGTCTYVYERIMQLCVYVCIFICMPVYFVEISHRNAHSSVVGRENEIIIIQ